MEQKIILNFESGETQEHILNGDRITLGRADDNVLVVKDGSISSYHAEIIKEDGSYKLYDLGSTNGTMVNGAPADGIVLKHGAHMTLGYVMSSFVTSEGIQKEHDDEIKAEEKIEELKKTKRIKLEILKEPEVAHASIAKNSAKPIDFNTMSPFKDKKEPKDKEKVVFVSFSIMSFASIIILLSLVFSKL